MKVQDFIGGEDIQRSLNVSDKQYYTYLHCKPDGIPFYVGKGKYKRAFDMKLRNEFHKRITNKYGIENINIFIFPCDSEDQAFKDEMQQIAQLKKEGYILANATDGGEGVSGIACSEELRKKRSLRMMGSKINVGKKYRLGIKHTAEAKIKISAGHLGKKRKPFTDEHKKKISDALKASKPWIGRVASEESRKKTSESLKKTWAKRKGEIK
jgi:hypothetical protein